MIKIYFFLISALFVNVCSFAQSNTFPGSGNVGIGTNNPATLLDVNGIIASKGIYNLGNSYSYNIANSLTGKTYEYKVHGAVGQFNTYQARWGYNVYTPYHYGVDLEWDVTVNPNGDFIKAFGIDHVGNGMFAGGLNVGGSVGIGTVNPEQRFTVVMDATTNGAGVAVKAVNRGAAGSQPGYSFLDPEGNKRMYSYLDVSSDTYNVANAIGLPLMTITQLGNLGIGTPNPDAKLAVNGTIHAKEIKVDLNVPGADYVFEKGYPLKTLSTVKKYIAINHHLPDMPSAKSMEQNGIDVSGMNMILLQKVEELTLYLIQIKKENAQLSKRLRKVENRK